MKSCKTITGTVVIEIEKGMGLGEVHEVFVDEGVNLTFVIKSKQSERITKFIIIRSGWFKTRCLLLISDFIASVADGHMDSFKDRYRKVDILLLDDVQFLGGKEQTLEEFFHTFNALYMEDKQIVLTSDQPPHELKGFEERLISRFVVGLTTDVQPPDLETRTAILSRKARADGLDLPMDVLEYIATRVTTNIRELEGALIRVTAFASLTKQPIDLTLAEMVLKDILSDPAGEQITAALIMAQTADYFGMTIDDLCGRIRTKTFVHARHVAM